MELIQSISLSILGGAWTLIVWIWWIIIPIILYFAWKNLKRANYVEDINHLVLSIKIPKNNDKGPVAAEMMFASLHGILQPKGALKSGNVVQEHLSFEIVASVNSIEFFVWVPEHMKDFVEGQVYAQYPTAEITLVDDYSKSIDIDNDKIDESVAGTELSLVKDQIYPIKTFQNFDVDPLAAITGMLSKLDDGTEKIWIQILAMPVDDDWRNAGLNHIESKKNGSSAGKLDLSIRGLGTSVLKLIPEMINLAINPPDSTKKSDKKEEKPKLSHSEEVELTAIEEKANKLGYKVKIRVVYLADTTVRAKERIQAVFGAFKQFNTTNLNGFKSDSIYAGSEFLDAYRARLFSNDGYILNIEELASLYHLPHVSVETPNIVWTSSKKGEPPADLPYITDINNIGDEITPLAMTTHRGNNKPFGIKKEDRARHMYVIGKSGTGKSRLLEYLAVSDIKRGKGVAIVDPHGELIDHILKYIPKERMNDVIYFNPADRDHPIAFNPLEATKEFREEVTNGFVSVLKKQFGYSWGPRLEYVLKHTVAALVEVEGSTMLGIVRMLTDKNYRKKIVSEVTDPVVQMFWLKEFASYNDKMATETIAPILNKVGQFTASPVIRNIVGQPKSKIDFAKVMNEQKILLVDLSTGKIGEANSELLGSMIITKLQLAAMSRAFIAEDDRKDFYLYVDEFQNFATESFAVILSEARKYRLSLTVANQYIAQMDETVRDAVFGNVGTLISFRVGATDAAFLEKEFTPVFLQNDLINLDHRHIYINMLIDGITSIPFSAMTLDSPKITDDLSAAIAGVSREKYGSPKEQIEENIRDWYNVDSVIAGVNANESDNPIPVKRNEEKDYRQNRNRDTDTRKTTKPLENSGGASSPNPVDRTLPHSDGNQNSDIKKAIADALAAKDKPVEKTMYAPVIKNEPEPSKPQLSVSNPKPEGKYDHIVINPQNIVRHSQQRPETNSHYKKIDKNTLRDIIREASRPKATVAETKIEQKPPVTEIENVNHHKPDEVKDELKTDGKIYLDREVKEITPEGFHSLKAIHPHETINIKKDAREIKPGDVVKF